jgi:hypothetical protein
MQQGGAPAGQQAGNPMATAPVAGGAGTEAMGRNFVTLALRAMERAMSLMGDDKMKMQLANSYRNLLRVVSAGGAGSSAGPGPGPEMTMLQQLLMAAQRNRAAAQSPSAQMAQAGGQVQDQISGNNASPTPTVT